MISPAMKDSFFGAVRVFLCVGLFLLPYVPPVFADVFGDVNDNEAEDIADAIISLRVASGLSMEGDILLAADVDDDQKIGLAEAIYVLQRLAGLRLPLFCLSTEESELARLINEYREENSLNELTLSKSLSYVARLHVRDLQDNHPDDGDCSMHSWSDQGEWTAVCDVGTAETWALTQAKPREVTEGVYAEDGFELAYKDPLRCRPRPRWTNGRSPPPITPSYFSRMCGRSKTGGSWAWASTKATRWSGSGKGRMPPVWPLPANEKAWANGNIR